MSVSCTRLCSAKIASVNDGYLQVTTGGAEGTVNSKVFGAGGGGGGVFSSITIVGFGGRDLDVHDAVECSFALE